MCTESQAYRDAKIQAPGLPTPRTAWEGTHGEVGTESARFHRGMALLGGGVVGGSSAAVSDNTEVRTEETVQVRGRAGSGRGRVKLLQSPPPGQWSSRQGGLHEAGGSGEQASS